MAEKFLKENLENLNDEASEDIVKYPLKKKAGLEDKSKVNYEHRKEKLKKTILSEKSKSRKIDLFEKEKAERRLPERIELRKKYYSLVSQWQEKERQINTIQRRYPGSEQDSEIRSAIDVIDGERNSIHKELRTLAPILGLSDDELTFDLIRGEILQEYGLPEFSLQEYANFYATPDEYMIKKGNFLTEDLDDKKISYPAENQVLLVFEPRWGNTWEASDPEIIKRFKIKRAKDFADFTGLPYMQSLFVTHWHPSAVLNKTTGEYDDLPDYILLQIGVVVPKDKIRQYLSIIQENPGHFRLDEKYYPDELKVEIELKKEAIRSKLKDAVREAYSSYGYGKYDDIKVYIMKDFYRFLELDEINFIDRYFTTKELEQIVGEYKRR